jgi:endonuclease YncB( thermonuclease family)
LSTGKPFQRRAARASTWVTGTLVLLAAAAIVVLAPWPITAVDGDTVDRLGWRHRLVGYDAPEIRRARCPAEREQALAAKARLAELIASAQRAELVPTRGRADPYGRTLSRLELDGQDVAQVAIREGWGVAYTGRGPRRDWCTIAQRDDAQEAGR